MLMADGRALGHRTTDETVKLFKAAASVDHRPGGLPEQRYFMGMIPVITSTYEDVECFYYSYSNKQIF